MYVATAEVTKTNRERAIVLCALRKDGIREIQSQRKRIKYLEIKRGELTIVTLARYSSTWSAFDEDLLVDFFVVVFLPAAGATTAVVLVDVEVVAEAVVVVLG